MIVMLLPPLAIGGWSVLFWDIGLACMGGHLNGAGVGFVGLGVLLFGGFVDTTGTVTCRV